MVYRDCFFCLLRTPLFQCIVTKTLRQYGGLLPVTYHTSFTMWTEKSSIRDKITANGTNSLTLMMQKVPGGGILRNLSFVNCLNSSIDESDTRRI